MLVITPESFYKTLSDAVAGDAAAFASINRWMRKFVAGIPAADADNVIQESWVRILEGLSQIRDPAAAVGWTGALLRNTRNTYLKAQTRRRKDIVLDSELEASSKQHRESDDVRDYTSYGRSRFSGADFVENIYRREELQHMSKRATAEVVCRIIMLWAQRVEMSSDQLVRLTVGVASLTRVQRKVLGALLIFSSVKEAAMFLKMPLKTVYGIRLKILIALRCTGISGRVLRELLFEIHFHLAVNTAWDILTQVAHVHSSNRGFTIWNATPSIN